MFKRHITRWLVGALAMTLFATGCGIRQDAVKTEPNSTNRQQAEQPTKQATTVYPLTYTDATGTTVTIEQEPQRIVSLLPSNTEILYALGLGDKVVGVTKWDDYPAEAKEKPIIGDLKPNAEAVLAQKPDLILGGASAQGADIEALRKLGLTVIAFEATTIAEAEQVIQDVGQITNTASQADEVVADMKHTVATVTAKTKSLSAKEKPRVYVELSAAPDIYTAAQGTFMDEMITLVGGTNIFGDLKGWKKVSSEQVVAKNPQVIIATHGTTEDMKQLVAKRGGWKQVEATKQGRILAVDTNLVSRPGPRLADGLLEFAKAIHPELFQ
ncbi:MAG TPA: ABC transporter substrate-binding protein [Bacilli bacterium]|nr:ABC transporter substrate-binding protein [Bacilli bacterium]